MSRINPKSDKEIFNDDVLDALPTNNKIRHGVGIFKRNNDPTFKEAIKLRTESLEWQQKNREANDKTTKSKKWKNAHANGVANRKSETAEEMQARLAKRDSNKDWHANRAQALKKLAKDPVWIENHKAVTAMTRKEIQTPYGKFESRQAAIDHMTSIGIGNARGKIVAWLKSKSKEYYYVKN